MKDLDPKEPSAVSGGTIAAPYPVPGSTPPYVPPTRGSGPVDCEPIPELLPQSQSN